MTQQTRICTAQAGNQVTNLFIEKTEQNGQILFGKQLLTQRYEHPGQALGLQLWSIS